MSRLVALTFILGSVAACSSDSGGSGVATDKPLTQLTPSERQQLCDYFYSAQGTTTSKDCGGITISVQTSAACLANLTSVSATCTATVNTAESCAEAAGQDLCNLLSSPACATIAQCGG